MYDEISIAYKRIDAIEPFVHQQALPPTALFSTLLYCGWQMRFRLWDLARSPPNKEE
jgi:hypothetical protein